MKQKKKNRYYTFMLSFIPGAAEMYMGFMKKGLSLMALFFVCLFGTRYMIGQILVFGAILVWFYSFFHARNLMAYDEDIFMELEDDFIWNSFINESNIQVSNPSLRKWVAGIMIVFGVVMLWQNFSQIIYCLIPDLLWGVLVPIVDTIPEVVISILIIYIGVRMIRGKKEELDGIDE